MPLATRYQHKPNVTSLIQRPANQFGPNKRGTKKAHHGNKGPAGRRTGSTASSARLVAAALATIAVYNSGSEATQAITRKETTTASSALNAQENSLSPSTAADTEIIKPAVMNALEKKTVKKKGKSKHTGSNPSQKKDKKKKTPSSGGKKTRANSNDLKKTPKSPSKSGKRKKTHAPTIVWGGKVRKIDHSKPLVCCYNEVHSDKLETAQALFESITSADNTHLSHVILLEGIRTTADTPRRLALPLRFNHMIKHLGIETHELAVPFKQHAKQHGNLYAMIADHEVPIEDPFQIHSKLKSIFNNLYETILQKPYEGTPEFKTMIAKKEALKPKLEKWEKQRALSIQIRDKLDLPGLQETLVKKSGLPQERPLVIHIIRGASHLHEKTRLRKECTASPYKGPSVEKSQQTTLAAQKKFKEIDFHTGGEELSPALIKKQRNWANRLEQKVIAQVIEVNKASTQLWDQSKGSLFLENEKTMTTNPTPRLSLSWQGETIPLGSKDTVCCYGEIHTDLEETSDALLKTISSVKAKGSKKKKGSKATPGHINHIVILEGQRVTRDIPQTIIKTVNFKAMAQQLRFTGKKLKTLQKHQQTHDNIFAAFSDHEHSLYDPLKMHSYLHPQYLQLLQNIAQQLKSNVAKTDPKFKELVARAKSLKKIVYKWEKKLLIEQDKRDKVNINRLKYLLVAEEKMSRDTPSVIHIIRGSSHFFKGRPLTKLCTEPIQFTQTAASERDKKIHMIDLVTKMEKLTLPSLKVKNRKIIEAGITWANTLEKDALQRVKDEFEIIVGRDESDL